MEVKKSAQADLERRKPTGFLLGLIVALALLLVALEFTSNPPEESNTDAEFDEMAQDYEMMPPEEQQEYEAPAPLVPAPALTERLNIVEEEVATDIKEEGEKTQEISNTETEGPKNEMVPPDDPTAPTLEDDPNNPLHFQVIERLPEFPGGPMELMKWLTKNLRYPHYAKSLRIEGKVVVSFIINTDGTTSDPLIVQSAHAYLDEEAMRVVRAMPRWKPGENHGKPCRTLFAIPVVFKL